MDVKQIGETISGLTTAFDVFKKAQQDAISQVEGRLDHEIVARRSLEEKAARLGIELSGHAGIDASRPWFDQRAVKALTGGNASYLLPEEHWGKFIDRMRPSSVLIESGVAIIKTESTALNMPGVATDPAATWRGETEPLPGPDPTYRMVRASPKKLATYVVVSRETFEDSSPEVAVVLERQMGMALALGLDKAAFQAQIENNANAPLTLRAIPGIQSSPVATDGAVPATIAWFHAAWSKYIVANGNLKTAALYMHPRDWATLLTIPEASGSNVPLLYHEKALTGGPTRSILGVPVYLTSQIPTNEVQGASSAVCSSAYLVDTAQLAIVMRQEARIEIDRSRHFDTDAVAVKGTLRADLVALNAPGVIHIPGFKVA